MSPQGETLFNAAQSQIIKLSLFMFPNDTPGELPGLERAAHW